MTRNNTFLLLLVSALLFASCKKDSSDKQDDSGEENTFTIDGTTYKATDVFFSEDLNRIRAQRVTTGTGLNNVQTVSVTFSDSELPQAGGSFDIVNDPYSPNNPDNNNQVSLLATTFPYDNGDFVDDKTYYADRSPVQHVTVSINSNGKVNVKFTNIKCTTQTGTGTVSGNITQP